MLREKRFWTQLDLRDAAKAIPLLQNKTPQWFSQFELGQISPREEVREAFAAVFGLELEEFDKLWQNNVKPLDTIEHDGIPVVNLSPAGVAVNYHEHGYTSRTGYRYIDRTENTRSPDLFAVRVIGDSMAPRIMEGDDVVLQPVAEGHPEEALEGRVVFVHFRDDDTNCLARLHWLDEEDRELGRRLELQKDNKKHKARKVWFAEIDQLAVMVEFRGRS